MSHNVTIADEKILRAGLKTFLEVSAIVGNVHTRRRKINNRADFVDKYGVTVAAIENSKIIRFCDIEFIRFEDSPDEGFDDCPVLIATYNLHLFHEFFEGTDDANSNDDFIQAILTLRDRFLETQDFAAGNFQAQSAGLPQGGSVGLGMPEFAQFGADAFTDATGHFTDLLLRFNLYDA